MQRDRLFHAVVGKRLRIVVFSIGFIAGIMPLDIRLFREAETLEEIRQSERRRFCGDEGIARVDCIVRLDLQWRDRLHSMEIARRDKNDISKAIAAKKKAKQDASAELQASRDQGLLIAQLEAEVIETKVEIDRLLPMVGNLIHDTVIVSNDENDNEVVTTFGETVKFEDMLPHNQLLYRIGGYEPERGCKVAGRRGYFMSGAGVMLNQALISFSLQFLMGRGYTPMQPPYFMNKDVMSSVAQLSDFDEALYHVGGDGENEKYLIATSEQPMCAFHMGEWFRSSSELPVKYAGFSTCFRKEAGKAGKDTWGVFRVHQFDKVEQFVITEPGKSWEAHVEMCRIAEEFLQALGLPYRVVNIVSGELNLAASKKYDIEAWFPYQGEYKELVSCTNCTDYQARAVDVRFGDKDDKQYVHMLNSTLCALTRTISCILENYQDEGGIKVPDVLVPFLAGKTYLPFIRGEQKIIVPVEKKKLKAQAKTDSSK